MWNVDALHFNAEPYPTGLSAVFRFSRWVACVGICLGGIASGQAQEPVDFVTQIAPIIQEHCIACHYPGHAEGQVSLASLDDLSRLGHLVSGDPDGSYLLELVTGADGNPPEMPQEGPALSRQEVVLMRRWIDEGAPWPSEFVVRQASAVDRTWWSLQPLQSQTGLPARSVAAAALPQASALNASQTIDRFIDEKLRDAGLKRNASADRRTLIRRATFDLTGLPPTPTEVRRFLRDDSPDAYARLIDRLLATPAYGERWGRHWLDVVRFGESTGYERNLIVNDAWPFRDYVIRAFNEDRAFDEVILEHVAGDVIAPDDPERSIASAFLVNGPHDIVGNQDAVQAAQIRANTIDEIIRATSEAFLGLTIGCARCHDHKFDPIPQSDYYQMYATFAGLKHGSRELASDTQKKARADAVRPIQVTQKRLNQNLTDIRRAISIRAKRNAPEWESKWVRPPVSRTGTQERFRPVVAQYVRLTCDGRDDKPGVATGFQIDEFEIWTSGRAPTNVALASAGAVAIGRSRDIEDFPGAYGPQLAIDGAFGARFIAASNQLKIRLAHPQTIDRVFFSSARHESKPGQGKFSFVADYRIEVSLDGQAWTEVASSVDRRPANSAHRKYLLEKLEASDAELVKIRELQAQLASLGRRLKSIPKLPTAWIGSRDSKTARGPFHVFLGGSPTRLGNPVLPGSLSVLSGTTLEYSLDGISSEAERRLAFAKWLVDPTNPLTPRVLVNRMWHYHFGTGIVSTPSDFGFMGQPPTHPELLDWLAGQLLEHGWKLKPLHRMIMLSETYRQSSESKAAFAAQDAESRWLWRFPPRRLSAEEIRDSMLVVSGELDRSMGGPGFRMFRYLQDNVATYLPLDQHDRSTYRRAVYHQNARACRIDLMTEFDQPDCAFSSARRAQTTTPLQALTALNHSFTLEMSQALSQRLSSESNEKLGRQIRLVFSLLFARKPTREEVIQCREFVKEHSLAALCRALLNTSEMIFVR